MALSGFDLVIEIDHPVIEGRGAEVTCVTGRIADHVAVHGSLSRCE